MLYQENADKRISIKNIHSVSDAMAVLHPITILYVKQNNHNVTYVKRWELTQNCADQVYHPYNRDDQSKQYPSNTHKTQKINQTEERITPLEQITGEKQRMQSPQSYIRELTNDLASINHIETKTFKNEKNVMLNKCNGEGAKYG